MTKLRNGRPDEIDLKIVQCLVDNGRATFAELGEAVGLTAPTCHDRVTGLQDAGVITGYTAKVDFSMLGRPVSAFILVDVRKNGNTLDAWLRGFDEITMHERLFGEWDLVLRIVTTMSRLNEFVTSLKSRPEVHAIDFHPVAPRSK